MRLLWFSIVVVMLSAGIAQAASDDLVISRSYWIEQEDNRTDSPRQFSALALSDKPFQPMNPVLALGYIPHPVWIRLTVAPHPNGHPVQLRIRPTFLDDVRLYEPFPGAKDLGQERRSGDRQPFASSERSPTALGFLLRPHAPYSTYYLRVQTTSSMTLHLEALANTDNRRRDAVLTLFQIGFLVFMGSVAAWALREFRLHREMVMAWFGVYQLGNLLHALTLMGYGAAFEPANASGLMDRITSHVIIALPLLALLFHRAVLALYPLHRFWMWGMYAFMGVSVGLQVLYIMGYQALALRTNAQLALVIGTWWFLMAWQVPAGGLPGRTVIRWVYSTLMVSLLLAMLPYLGWVQAVEWSLQGTLAQGVIGAGLMTYMLARRSRSLLQRAQASQRAAELAQAQLQQKAQEAAEQARFMDMLTHEIKTPLSVALMSVGAAEAAGGWGPAESVAGHLRRIRRSLGHVDAVVNLTSLALLTEHQRLEPQWSECRVSELVYDCIESSEAPERVKASVGFNLTASSDSQLLAIIVSNLLNNALKYAPAQHTVDISLQRHLRLDRDGLCLRVSNPVGPAGTPDPQRVFTKYYRSKGAQGKNGAGLGLYLSHSLATLLGATLHYRPQPDCVIFELWIPA